MSESGFEHIQGLECSPRLLEALREMGIGAPNDMQRDAIAAALEGRPVLIHAPTGTGKTLAYLLPILQRLTDAEGRAVVFAPGVELAMQVFRIANALKAPELKAGPAISTANPKRERKRIQKSTRLVVGTPDRLLPLFQQGKLKGTRWIVLDELEPILSAKGADWLFSLLSRSEPPIQLLVASATLGRRSHEFIDRFMGEAFVAKATEQPMHDQIAHHVLRAKGSKGKETAMVRFMERHRCRRAIVFASDPRQQSYLFHFFEDHGIRTGTLRRDRTKQQRQQALASFAKGEADILLTTDDSARGLDLPDVEWVFHYDVPNMPEAYIHRAGRTGRAQRSGHSVVLADDRSAPALGRLGRALGVRFRPYQKPSR